MSTPTNIEIIESVIAVGTFVALHEGLHWLPARHFGFLTKPIFTLNWYGPTTNVDLEKLQPRTGDFIKLATVCFFPLLLFPISIFVLRYQPLFGVLFVLVVVVGLVGDAVACIRCVHAVKGRNLSSFSEPSQ